MSNETAGTAGPVIEALADPVRRQVVTLLSDGPRRAGQLAGAAGMSAPAMSRRRPARAARGFYVIEDERIEADARARVFRLRPQALLAVQAWLDQIQAGWNEQLASYKRHLEGGSR